MNESENPENAIWLTYAQAGERLGISPAAARMFAKRRGWPRRTPNARGQRAMVFAPLDQLRSALSVDVITNVHEHANGHDQAEGERVITVLRELLAEKAARLVELQAEKDARIAELVADKEDLRRRLDQATGEASAFRALLTDQREKAAPPASRWSRFMAWRRPR